MELKVGDFGLATKLEFEGDRKRTVCGTPNYIAPEILDGKHGHSYEVDIWSLGVIIYTLLLGKPPFETSDVKTTYHKIKMNSYSFPDHITISSAAKDLISKILNLDPTKRPSLDEILAHGFFHTGNAIPKLLPASTLACPPSSSYIRQFIPNSNDLRSSTEKPRLEGTAPIQQLTGTLKSKDNVTNAASTARDTLSLKQSIKPSTAKGTIGSARDSTPSSVAAKTKSPPKNAVQDKIIIKPDAVASSATIQGPSIWVKKWADYSSKYGLGYILSNGCPGIFFNDATKIILDSNG